MNALKKLSLSTLAALTSVSLFAAPLKVSDVKVTTAAPHGIAIDYKVSDVQPGAEDYVLEVALTLTNGTTKTAKTLSGDTSASAGPHRIYWNIAKDGVASFAGATVSVSYINPLEVVCDGKKYCVIDLSAGSNAASYPLEFLDDTPAGGFNADVYKKTKLVLKRIEAGDFIMGADQTSANALAKCKVTLTKAFYVGLFQVTQRQYELVTGSNPANFKSNGEKRPVERVSYNMIRARTPAQGGPSARRWTRPPSSASSARGRA